MIVRIGSGGDDIGFCPDDLIVIHPLRGLTNGPIRYMHRMFLVQGQSIRYDTVPINPTTRMEVTLGSVITYRL